MKISWRVGLLNVWEYWKTVHLYNSCDKNVTVCRQVVNVWEVSKRKERKALVLKKPLYGHTEPVTCLAASDTYNIIISGSRDRTCIVWDMNLLCFLRQLRGHAAPVAAVAINDLTVRLSMISLLYLPSDSCCHQGSQGRCIDNGT